MLRSLRVERYEPRCLMAADIALDPMWQPDGLSDLSRFTSSDDWSQTELDEALKEHAHLHDHDFADLPEIEPWSNLGGWACEPFPVNIIEPSTTLVSAARSGAPKGSLPDSTISSKDTGLVVPALDSLSGAAASVYLDFDGHVEPVWGSYTNVISPPLDMDGDATSFSDEELTYIEDVWKIVAEDFSPFNINVTTVQPSTLAAGLNPSLANGNALRVAIGGGVDFLGLSTGVIGYAYLSSFTSSIANVAYAMPVRSDGSFATAFSIGSVASHEAGHSFGLRHQEQGYNLTEKWQTIMYPILWGMEDAYWTTGVNELGNNQDDMAVLANSTNGFGYRTDDHANLIAGASTFASSGGQYQGTGVISSSTDVDIWKIPAGSGESMRVTVSGSEIGQNLDAVIELLDASGNVIKSADPSDSADVAMSIPLTQDQYLRVRSTGEYGRVGQYNIQLAPAAAGIEVAAPTTLMVDRDGRSDQFTVALQSRPTADVVVDVAISGSSHVGLSTPQLVFTATNWHLPQVISVTSVEDNASTGASSFLVELAVHSTNTVYEALPAPALAGIRADDQLAGWVGVLQTPQISGNITIYGFESSPDGGAIAVGRFSGSVDFDLGPGQTILSSVIDTNVFIARYSATGQLQWAVPIESTGVFTSPDVLKVDAQGNIYVGGTFYGANLTVGTTTLTNQGSYDVFLAKFTPSGAVTWARAWGNTTVDSVSDLEIDAAGNVVIVGNYEGTLDFNPGTGTVLRTSAGASDLYLLRLNSAGNYVSVTTLGGSNSEFGRQLELDSSGNVYISGYFGTATQLGSFALTSSGTLDGYLLKMSATGSVLWAKQAISEAGTGGNLKLARSSTGRIFWGSQFIGDMSFGPGTPTLLGTEANDIFVSVWDDAGNFINAGVQASDQLLTLLKMSADAAGNVIMAGRLRGVTDLDPSANVTAISPVGVNADFIVRADSNLNLLNTVILPLTTTGGTLRALAVDAQGDILVAGSFVGSVVMPTGEIFSETDSSASYLARFKLNPGVTVNPLSALEVSEAGGSTALQVSLNTAPTADVVLTLQSSDGTEGTVAPAQLTFNASNWNQPQTVQVTGVDDLVKDGDTTFSVTLSSISSDSAYQGLSIPSLVLINRDNEAPQLLFDDSFEVGEWNGKWVEDSQNDWYRSTQRATNGTQSAEVDGAASNATLTLANSLDLSAMASAELTFSWLIESGFDAGESVSLDISTNGGTTWTSDVRRLQGNVSQENVWFSEVVDLTPYLSSQLRVRFRALVSAADEDANVDNVRITGLLAGPNLPPIANAGSGYAMNEGSSVTLSGVSSSDPDGTLVSYAWNLDNDGQYDDASGPTTNYTTRASGSQLVRLLVTDNRGATASATTSIVVANIAPTANAGADQAVLVGAVVNLSAAASSDPGLDIVQYAWDLDNDGAFDDASGANVSFVATAAGTFTPRVLVTDADGASGVDAMQLVVTNPPTETTLFEDSFEVAEWNGRWVEDSQNDWLRSTQRATQGSRSAEVDGPANNATLSMASGVNVNGYSSATLTFDWLIESGFDAGEFLALDISTNGGTTWIQNVKRLEGNVNAENVWSSETVNLGAYASTNLKIRFRSTVSDSTEDANVDNIKIIGRNS